MQTPITGRQLSKSKTQVAGDVQSAVTRAVKSRGLGGKTPATLEIALTKVQLVSPGQSWAVGGRSYIEGVVTLKSSSGQVLVAPQTVKAFSDEFAWLAL